MIKIQMTGVDKKADIPKYRKSRYVGVPNRKISANTCYLWRVIHDSNNDLDYAFAWYFDNKDIIFLRFMVISIGERNGAAFSFPHLFAQALPPAGHNKNIYITSP